MITRFEVDGFKSLRDFAVDLEPLTVFVGPNGAGKSNLLEAIGLLGRLASMSLEEAFKLGRGRIVDQFSRSGGEAGRTIRIAVEVLLQSPLETLEDDEKVLEDNERPLSGRYRYELVIERRVRPSGTEELAIADECLRVADASKGSDGREIVFQQRQERGQIRYVLMRPEDQSQLRTEMRFPRTHSVLGAQKTGALALANFSVRSTEKAVARLEAGQKLSGVSDEDIFNVRILSDQITKQLGIDTPDMQLTGRLADELSRCRLLQLDAARLREPSERIASHELAPDASNLPTILADLPGPALGEIRADLVSLIPGLAGFDVVPDEDTFRIEFKLSGGERFPARLASDGTLRALALLTALHVEPRPSILGIEEPENGIYPGRLRTLLSLLREIATSGDEASLDPAQRATQLLLTSHSPVVLAAFRDSPEHLRFMDLVRRDGRLATRARAVGELKAPGDGAHVVSLREVDALLQAAGSEAAE
ncbi:hypothetical protein SOCEGT47_008340 [Sorangium cellulosum]|uniref:ATPase AAA-type core domain-containing protein n=1 Tax=Sorangium cellulosum TaxID=56 RepID=A0A4P2PUC9_SORCE|nr:AAA family ATPase [Sorangium cellulosum]AUX20365.1 hypothetical protein SOCEGT47_008340 [Sorangium cellulosum]